MFCKPDAKDGQAGTQGGQGAGNDSTESNPIYNNGGTLGNGGNHGVFDCGGAGFNGPIGVSNDARLDLSTLLILDKGEK